MIFEKLFWFAPRAMSQERGATRGAHFYQLPGSRRRQKHRARLAVSYEILEQRSYLSADASIGSFLAPYTSAIPAPASDTLTIHTRDSYLPGVAVLVEVELTGSDGKPDRAVWDSTATLTTDNPAITLSTNQVNLHNGLGSALVVFNGSGDFKLTATSGALQSERTLTSLAGMQQTAVSGTLSGTSTDWSGIIHVTGDVRVPVGHTLTIEPGTLILVDGNSVGQSTNGKHIEVLGKIESLGTEEHRVTFTATVPNAPWGDILHTNAQPSTYAYTDITRAGHAPSFGHTGTGPAIRTEGSTIDFDHSNITDIAGKTMQAFSSNLHFDHALFSRSVMGPETEGTGVILENSYIIDMLGQYREDGKDDDDDGIYLHGSGGPTIAIRDSVVAHTGDDGIDTLGANLSIENMIIRDCNNPNEDAKGISLLYGNVNVNDCLLVNNKVGISMKVQAASQVGTLHADHVTVVGGDVGIQAYNKYGIPNANITFFITNAIVRSTKAIYTDYDPAKIHVSYSDLSTSWAGTGNITADPLFVDAPNHDFNLSSNSPAIDAGDPASPNDPDGTRTDMGVLPYTHPTAVAATVVGRRVFYNGSKFDGNNIDANAADDAAIAPDKAALLSGGTATFANYTSYSKGLNGVVVDVKDLPAGTLSVADFTFKVGNSNDPSTWTDAPAPANIAVRPGAGTDGSSRVELIWADRAIQKQWLQVTMNATANTGLAAPDVFYFGNAVGEAGNSTTNALVNAGDEIAARNDPHTILNPAPITNTHDYSRDGLVNAQDQIIARNNGTTIVTTLRLITVPGVAVAAPVATSPYEQLGADNSTGPASAAPTSAHLQLELPSTATQRADVRISGVERDQVRAALSEAGTENGSDLPNWSESLDELIESLAAARLA